MAEMQNMRYFYTLVNEKYENNRYQILIDYVLTMLICNNG